MTWLQRLLAYIVLLLIVGVSGYFSGKSTVQNQWDKDKAVRAALLNAEKNRNEKTVKDLKDQHERDVNHAKTKAGRDAVNRWLREHRLLPTRPEVRDCGSEASTNSPKVPNGASEEQWISGGIEGFAINCADDASRLTDWQELCRVAGCVVSE